MRTAAVRTALATIICGYLGSACVMPTTPAAKSDQSAARAPIATVNGQAIYEDELLPAIRPQLQQLRTQEYQIKRQALEPLIQKKVLEARAKEERTTVEKLLEREIPEASEPTGEQVQAVYDAQKNVLKRPLSEVQTQIRQALKQAQMKEAQKQYTQLLRAQADVDILLNPPRIEVSYDPARVRGNPNAPVTVIEFSDFECPYCKAAQPTLKQVLAKYGDKVRLSYRDFPLNTIHPHAQSAAEAARCAGEQNRFWEYHDLIFADTARLDPAALREHAHALGLDEKQFDSCLASGRFQPQIQNDVEAGVRSGVNGTPGFFINGVLLSGAQPAAAFEQLIDSELKAISAGAKR